MAQETQLLKLDLDTKDFNQKADVSQEKISQIGQGSQLDGLISGLTSAGKVLGVMATVGAAAKLALDMTLEAESVKQVNQQFDILTRNAGISGEVLKNSLAEVAEGLVDDEDLLKATSEAVVRLGKSAERLPEIFEVAKNMTRAFGGELLDNYSKLNEAISTGNTRALRSANLVIDQKKALKDYADSINKLVPELTAADQRQAVLNAVIEKGKIAFQGIDGSVTQTTESWQRLKVTLGNLKETASVVFESAFGKIVRAELEGLTAIAETFSRFMLSKFGQGPEAARATMARLTEQINQSGAEVFDLEEKVDRLGKQYGAAAKYMTDYGDAVRALAGEEQNLAALRAQYKELSAQVEADDAAKKIDAAKSINQAQQEEDDKGLQRRSKFESDLLNLRLARINQEIEVSTSVGEVEQLQIDRKLAMQGLLAAKEQELDALVSEKQMTRTQKEQELAELRKSLAADIRQVEKKTESERLNALQNLANTTSRTSQGFANGFKAASKNATKDLGNFSKMGEQAFGALQKNATSAFMELGKGTKKAGDIMKGFFLNSLADMAESQGALLLANITNPAGMAAGAGLLVLAGFLRSQAGEAGAGGGGGSKAAIGASSASVGSGGVTSSAMDYERPQVEESRRRRDVQLVIQGSYFETEQTKRTLMEMIRSETDATGFSYVQIGQGA